MYHTVNERSNLAKKVRLEDLLALLVEVVFPFFLSPGQPKLVHTNNGSLPK